MSYEPPEMSILPLKFTEHVYNRPIVVEKLLKFDVLEYMSIRHSKLYLIGIEVVPWKNIKVVGELIVTTYTKVIYVKQRKDEVVWKINSLFLITLCDMSKCLSYMRSRLTILIFGKIHSLYLGDSPRCMYPQSIVVWILP